jgi:hypothetical protein
MLLTQSTRSTGKKTKLSTMMLQQVRACP